MLSVQRLLETVTSAVNMVPEAVKNCIQTLKAQHNSESNIPRTLFLFLVRNDRGCYQVMVALEEKDQIKQLDEKLDKARQNQLRYPCGFMGKNIFGGVPDIVSTYRVIEIVGMEEMINLLQDFQPEEDNGLLFFKYSLHWASYNMHSESEVETGIRRVLCNQFGELLGRFMKCGWKADGQMYDSVSQLCGLGNSVFMNLSPSEIVSLNSTLPEEDQFILADIVSKMKWVSPQKFNSFATTIFNIAIREFVSKCDQAQSLEQM